MKNEPNWEFIYTKLMRMYTAVNLTFIVVSFIATADLMIKTWISLDNNSYRVTLFDLVNLLSLACNFWMASEAFKSLHIPQPNLFHVASSLNIGLVILALLLREWSSMKIINTVQIISSAILFICSILSRRLLFQIMNTIDKLQILPQYKA